MHEKVVSQIVFEIEQIDILLDSYSELLRRARQNSPDLVEVTALASIIHSFYNGLENIFLNIAKKIDGGVPDTQRWHRDLLTQMSNPTQNREPIISAKVADRLADYLGFRHFYRHSYSFFLDWEELEKLVMPLEEVWTEVKTELEIFLAGLIV